MSTRKRTIKHGDGVIGDLVNKILPTRQQFPPKVRALIQKYKDYQITSIVICRNPIQSYVTGFLNLLSGGNLDQELKKLITMICIIYL